MLENAVDDGVEHFLKVLQFAVELGIQKREYCSMLFERSMPGI